MKTIKAVLIVIGILLLLGVIFGSCDSGSGSSSYSKYSSDYRNDKQYRDNVDKIADAYGKDSDEVDRMIQRVAEAQKNG